MKLFATVSLLTFLLLLPLSVAQVERYAIDINLDERGNALVNIKADYKQPQDIFRYGFKGKLENFNTNTDCNLVVNGITLITCNLKQEKRLEINFATNDLVTAVTENRYYFASDFTLNRAVDYVVTTVTLPEGMILLSKNQTQFEYVVYPEEADIRSDGRRIFITWKLTDVLATSSLKFEVLYERLVAPPWFQLQLRHFLLAGVGFAVVLSFILLRYFKRSEKLVLSVLDDYERKIVDLLIASEGVINQRKVVQATNLSKAKVSRVVKSLVERGLIEVERIGRTNRLKLIKKKIKV